MLSSLLITLPMVGSIALASPAQLFERAACNKDNCLNVMTNTLSVATPFCSTYLQSTSTVYVTPIVTVSGTDTTFPLSTAYPTIPGQVTPTHIATQCQLATPTVSSSLIALTARYTSACKCLPTPIVPGTVTTTVSASATTTTITPSPTPISLPFILQVEGSNSIYDGYHLAYYGCPSGDTGQPYLSIDGSSGTPLVFGSDGFLHVQDCFNVVTGVFSGDEPAVLFLVDPTTQGSSGFVPSPCTAFESQTSSGDTVFDLSCTGANGETVFYFPVESFGLVTELYFGDANYGQSVEVRLNLQSA